MSDNVASQLKAVEIEPMRSINGAEFYHHLSNILPSSEAVAKYKLIVKFSHTSVPIALQKNAEVLRQATSQLVKYRLIDKETGNELTSGRFKQVSSYSTTFAAYAVYAEEAMTFKNLSRQAAEEIYSRLLLYFNNNINTKPGER